MALVVERPFIDVIVRKPTTQLEAKLPNWLNYAAAAQGA